jgi:LPS sulfotransferase NodH
MKEPSKFLVLTTSRSGSTMFMDSLNCIDGVEGHMELFLDQYRRRPPIAGCNDYPRFIERRPQLPALRPRATWRYLSSLYERDRCVGFKLMYTHLRNYPEILPYAMTRNIRIVHLVRSNHLDTVISEQLARLTGDSHTIKDDWRMERAIRLDPGETVDAVRKRARQVRLMSLMCRTIGNRSLTVCYEELVQDYTLTMRRVCNFLDIRSSGDFQQTRLKKRQTREKREVIGNYDDIEAALSRHGYGHLVAS